MMSPLMNLQYRGYIITLATLAILPFYVASAPPSGAQQAMCPNSGFPMPIAEMKSYYHEYPHGKRYDPFHWLELGNRADVGQYLRQETDYANKVVAKIKPLQDKLKKEIWNSIPIESQAGAWMEEDYLYYTRSHSQLQYPIYYRKHISVKDSDKVVLDPNTLDGAFNRIGKIKAGRKGTLLAFTVSQSGSEDYTLYFKDLNNNQLLSDKIEHVTNAFEWSASGNSIIYVAAGKTTDKYNVFRHVINSSNEKDILLNEKGKEITFHSMEKSTSKQYIFIYTTNEERPVYLLYTGLEQQDSLLPFIAPVRNASYRLYHLGTEFLIMIKVGIEWNLFNYKDFYVSDVDKLNQPTTWTKVLGNIDARTVSNVIVAHSHVTIFIRDGLTTIIQTYDFYTKKGFDPKAKSNKKAKLPDPSYAITHVQLLDFNGDVLTFRYSTLTRPTSKYSYNMATNTLTETYRDSIPGYDPSQYVTEVIYAKGDKGSNGKRPDIPITIAYKKSMLTRKGNNPAWLTAYGAYGIVIEPKFDSANIPLFNRGFVYAIAHIRGGGEFGVEWHNDGARHNKLNSFTDFIYAAKKLFDDKYTRKERLVISGNSAGGMLIGGVLNMTPDIAKVAILNVPCLDLLGHMSDTPSNIVSTSINEWGNPKDRNDFQYIIRYSPYENIQTNTKYPNILVLSGFNDARVPYWNPAKWIAKLRASNVANPKCDSDPHTIVAVTDMNGGHAFNSNIRSVLSEYAMIMAYAIEILERSSIQVDASTSGSSSKLNFMKKN